MLLCTSVCSSLWAADFHALDVKTGQWETTVTGQITGAPAIPAEVLTQLTPEQRAKMESAMGGRGAKPMVTTSCKTKEKLNQAWTTGQNQKSCTTTVTSSSSSKQEVHLECSQDGAHSWLVSDECGVGRQPRDGHELYVHVEVVGRGLHRD
jgi:hypothetical protein